MVALHALPVVCPERGGSVGGTETRAWLLARGLASFSNDVVPRLVVRGNPADVPAAVDDVSLIAKHERLYDWYVNVGRSVHRRAGFPPIAIVRWRPELLWQLPVVAAHRLMRSRPTDPTSPEKFFNDLTDDVLVAFGVQSTAATVIASAHATGRPAAVVLGCDDDLDARYLTDPEFINPYGDSGRVCRWILDNADVVLTQTDWQQRTLAERFGRDGVLIPNPIEIDRWQTDDSDDPTQGRNIAGHNLPDRFLLWVGRAEGVHKRPQKLIELARECPGVQFVMVMNPADAVVEHEVRAFCPENVVIIDRVRPDNMPALFQRSLALVNTSSTEGFPNTYLQAAAAGRPVLSLVVLAKFIQANRLGRAYDDDVSLLATAARSAYAAREGSHEELGFDATTAFQFVAERHGLESVSHKFAAAIAATVARRSS